jgi:hypothetical protein
MSLAAIFFVRGFRRTRILINALRLQIAWVCPRTLLKNQQRLIYAGQCSS